MTRKEIKEEDIKNILNGLHSIFQKEYEEEFEKRFPMLVEDIKKYSKEKPSEIQFYVNFERDKLNKGSRKLYKDLPKTCNKKMNWALNGILNGSLYEALDIACNRYTDITRKLFNAVYHHIVANEVVNVYKEYTKEEIEALYNEDKYYQEHYTLEEMLKKYVGKPKLSLEMFKNSQDIIDWYYNLRMIYIKMCKYDLKEVLENEQTRKKVG